MKEQSRTSIAAQITKLIGAFEAHRKWFARKDIYFPITETDADRTVRLVSQLYWSATAQSRTRIQNQLRAIDLWGVEVFIRRIGFLETADLPITRVRLAVGAASVDVSATYERDMIVSFCVLRFALEQHRHNACNLIRQVQHEATDALREVLKNVVETSKSDLSRTITTFGPRGEQYGQVGIP